MYAQTSADNEDTFNITDENKTYDDEEGKNEDEKKTM